MALPISIDSLIRQQAVLDLFTGSNSVAQSLLQNCRKLEFFLIFFDFFCFFLFFGFLKQHFIDGSKNVV
jgi:hypothetical protein